MDTTGKMIRKLVEAEMLPGEYTVSFNGSMLPSGVYYARLQNGAVSQVRSMLIVR
jgi:hypothetical protein